MDVTSLLNTRAVATPAVATPRSTPTPTPVKLAHERQDSSSGGIADVRQQASWVDTNPLSDDRPQLSIVVTPSAETMPSSRRSSASQSTPSQNRTPWDAGGFSLSSLSSLSLARDDGSTGSVDGAAPAPPLPLPLPLPSVSASSSAPRSRPPLHRFSDSRSSFSSACTNASSASSASSTTNDSISHSRLSSLSTVSENPPLSTLLADVSLLEMHTSEKAAPVFCLQEQEKKTSSTMQNAAPAESTSISVHRDDRASAISLLHSSRSPGRVQSPSDAMLILRAGSQDDEADDLLSESTRLPLRRLHAHAHESTPRLPVDPSRRHKRAVSAPDFASINNPSFTKFGPIPEPTPSPSEHGDETAMKHDILPVSPAADRHKLPPTYESESPTSGSSYGSDMQTRSAPVSSSPQGAAHSPMAFGSTAHGYHHEHTSAPSMQSGSNHHYAQSPTRADGGPQALAELPVNFEVASACMYRGDCQTGSQLRKAISHIFGRNKLCTRMIPAGVWVHYCRKHYQRTRYRNGGEYPQRQIALVQEQVRRVQAWSDANVQQGCSPILKDWSLSVRKREQLRLDTKMAVLGKKRPFRDDNGQEDERDDALEDDRAEMNGTAVPDWVVAQIGDGYSTSEILSVVDRLKSDIDQGRLQQIPDIEILPNIVTDSGSDELSAMGGTPKKSYTRRRTSGGAAATGLGGGLGSGGHRRSQSVNTAGLRPDAVPMARRRSQPNSNTLSSAPPTGFLPPRMLHSNEQPQTPLEKRQRIDSEGTVYQPMQVQGDGGAGERQLPYRGRMQLAHQPAFAGIRECQAESMDYRSGCYMFADERPSGVQTYGATDGYYPPPVSTVAAPPPLPSLQHPPPQSLVPAHQEHHYSNGSATASLHEYDERRDYDYRRFNSASGPNGVNGHGVLPAPNPQRFGGPSVAQQLETSSYVLNSAAARRSGTHQRSQSEAGFFHPPPSSHKGRPTSPGGKSLSAFMGGPSAYATNGPSSFGSRYSQGVMPVPSSFSGQNQEHDSPGGFHDRQSHVSSHHGSQFDDEWRGGPVSNQPAPAPQPYAYANADVHETYRFESVQLPPLQSIHGPSFPNHSHQHSTRRDYVGSSKHTRHQSSPAVTRMLPTTMEVSAGPAQVALPTVEGN